MAGVGVIGTPTERFWAKVDKNGPSPVRRPDLGPCWLWTATRTERGYGQFWMNRRYTLAHRTAYGLTVGPIPEGLSLDHLCRNRGCVNPSHTEPVTMQVNLLRGEGSTARYARRTHCPEGHPFAGSNLAMIRGHRRCRECHRAKGRAYSLARSVQRAPA